jgi:hypothetical protein
VDSSQLKKAQNLLRTLFKSLAPSFQSQSKVVSVVALRMCGGDGGELSCEDIRYVRSRPCLNEVKFRLRREQEERTQKRIGELFCESEQKSEV